MKEIERYEKTFLRAGSGADCANPTSYNLHVCVRQLDWVRALKHRGLLNRREKHHVYTITGTALHAIKTEQFEGPGT